MIFFGHKKKNIYICGPLLDVAQLVAHLVRDQEVAGSSPVIQTQQAWRPFRRHAFLNSTGELSEWLKEPASKTGVRVTVPGVRIPHSPQPRMASQRSCGAFLLKGASRACSRKTLSAKKHQRAAGPGCHSRLQGPRGERPGNAQPPGRAQSRQGMHSPQGEHNPARECTGPPARAQSRQECTGPPARAQSRQGMHRAPGPSTIP